MERNFSRSSSGLLLILRFFEDAAVEGQPGGFPVDVVGRIVQREASHKPMERENELIRRDPAPDQFRMDASLRAAAFGFQSRGPRSPMQRNKYRTSLPVRTVSR